MAQIDAQINNRRYDPRFRQQGRGVRGKEKEKEEEMGVDEV